MTFVGEAVGPFYSPDLSASALALRADDSTVTLAAGVLDDVVMSYREYYTLLSDSDAVFQLVLVALSGSASVRVTYGGDPGFDQDRAYCTSNAGTFTVATGETEVDLPDWSAAWYWDMDEEPLVRLEVLSGSVVLDQARLRIWPPGGFGGGWSETVVPTTTLGPFPAGTRYLQDPDLVGATTDPPGLTLPTRVERPTDDDRAQALADAQEYARSDYDSATTATVTADTISTSGFNATILNAGGFASARRYAGEEVTNDPIGSFAEAGVTAKRAYIVRSSSQGNPAGTYGVDWVRHPDRVSGEPDAPMEMMGDQSWSWVQGTATFVATSGATSGGYWFHLPGPYYLAVGGLPELPAADALAAWTPIGTPGTIVPMTVPDTLTTSPGYVTTLDLPEVPNDPVVTFELTHPIIFGNLPAVPGYDYAADPDQPWLRAGQGSGTLEGGTFTLYDVGTGEREGYDPLSYYLHPAPYRYWTPTAQTLHPHRLMQRGDGLGMGSGRVYSTGTRQGSSRVYGTF